MWWCRGYNASFIFLYCNMNLGLDLCWNYNLVSPYNSHGIYQIWRWSAQQPLLEDTVTTITISPEKDVKWSRCQLLIVNIIYPLLKYLRTMLLTKQTWKMDYFWYHTIARRNRPVFNYRITVSWSPDLILFLIDLGILR